MGKLVDINKFKKAKKGDFLAGALVVGGISVWLLLILVSIITPFLIVAALVKFLFF